MNADVQLFHDDENGLVATWRSVVIVVIRRAMPVELLAASVRANRAIVPRYPKGVASLSTSHIGIRLPTAIERKAAGESIAAVRSSVRCAAQVLGGEGFWVSAARSIVTGIESLRPDDRPRRTFGRIADATRWMAGHMDEDEAWSRRLELVTEDLLARGAGSGSSSQAG